MITLAQGGAEGFLDEVVGVIDAAATAAQQAAQLGEERDYLVNPMFHCPTPGMFSGLSETKSLSCTPVIGEWFPLVSIHVLAAEPFSISRALLSCIPRAD